MKEFWKSVKISQSYRHEFRGPVFLEHSVLCLILPSVVSYLHSSLLFSCAVVIIFTIWRPVFFLWSVGQVAYKMSLITSNLSYRKQIVPGHPPCEEESESDERCATFYGPLLFYGRPMQ